MFMMQPFSALAIQEPLAKVVICFSHTRIFSSNLIFLGIGLAEQLFNSNVVALMGGGDDPQFEQSKVPTSSICQ